MRSSTRSRLFLSFTAIFIAVTPIVVLYSQGYRIDWKKGDLIKTGALFIEPHPAPVELYINEKLKKERSFIFQNIYIGNLLPKSYNVQVKKDGYSTWKKNLTVLPKLVTEAKNVRLFPRNKNPERLMSNVKNFYFAPSKKYIAIVEKSTAPQINIFSLEERREFLLFTDNATTTDYDISEVKWSADSSKLAVSLRKNNGQRWLILEATNQARRPDEANAIDITEKISSQADFKNYTKKLYRPKIEYVEWSHVNSNEAFVIVADAYMKTLLFTYSLRDSSLTGPLIHNVSDFVAQGNKIIYLSSIIGNINFFDMDSGQIRHGSFKLPKAAENGDLMKGGKEIIYELSDSKFAILIDGVLYLYDSKINSLEKLYNGVRKIAMTADGKRLMVVKANSIIVYWLLDVHFQPFRDTGDTIAVVETDSEIYDAVWLSENNEYIIYSEKNGIHAIELDERDYRNQHKLAADSAAKVYYNEINNTLYFLARNSLYSLPLN